MHRSPTFSFLSRQLINMFIHVNTLLICVIGAFAAGVLFGAVLVCCTLGCQTLLLRLTLWRRGSRASSRETSPRSLRRSYNISPKSSAPEASEQLLTQNNIPCQSPAGRCNRTVRLPTPFRSRPSRRTARRLHHHRRRPWTLGLGLFLTSMRRTVRQALTGIGRNVGGL